MRRAMILTLVLFSSGWVLADEPDQPAGTTGAAVKSNAAAGATSAAEGGEPAANVGETVRLLIRELDAGQKSRREEAEKKLLALGAKALDYLPENTDRLSAEAGQRLDRVREKLEKSEAEN